MPFEQEVSQPLSVSDIIDIPDPGPAPAPRLMPGLPLWVAMALAGLACIQWAAILEGRAEEGQVWIDAILVTEGTPPWDDTIPVSARVLPGDAFPFEDQVRQGLAEQAGGAEAAEILGLHIREHLVAIDLPADTIQSVLASGRAPEPGKPEVLAGALVRLDEFTIDGTVFTVVGRLQRGATGLAMAYLLPSTPAFDALFEAAQGGTQGWFDPEGLVRLEDAELDEDSDFATFLGLTPTEGSVTWMAFVGLALVLVGGGGAQVLLFRWLAPRTWLLRPFLDTLNVYPRALTVAHVVYFGAFLGMTGVAMAFPVMNLRVLTWVTSVFTTGDLRHIGDAYFDKNIIGAAWHTFANNFIDQTFIGVILPGTFVPLLGTAFALLKNLISFSLAGFAMAPIWTRFVLLLTYHSITIVLELEAYVLATFMVTLVPVRLFGALHATRPLRELARCGAMVVGGTFFIAGMLAFAAVYEAVTLVALP
ncbi:MAG: hypothetical protein GY851_27080 [bacterium]|nr:hypothetical protein [bacterium]